MQEWLSTRRISKRGDGVYSEESQQDSAEKRRGRGFADEVGRTADGDKRGAARLGNQNPSHASRIG